MNTLLSFTSIFPLRIALFIPLFFSLFISILIQGCGGSAKENESTETLYLHQPQATFTTPSRLEINSDDGNIYCSEVLLEYPDKNTKIAVFSVWYPELNKVFCALDNLPSDIDKATRLNIRKSYFDSDVSLNRQFDNPGRNLNGATNPQAVLIRVGKVKLDEYIPIATPGGDYILPQLDVSGATSALTYILNTKYGYSYNEQEIFELILQVGETDKIINRRGFSLLDLKKSYEYLGITAAGFLVSTDTAIDGTDTAIERSDILFLQDKLPFISVLKIYERPMYVVVTDLTMDGITALHPNLGYLYLSLKDLSEGQFLDTDGWLVLVNDI